MSSNVQPITARHAVSRNRPEELSQARSRLQSGKRRGLPLTRVGIPQMTPMQRRMQDPANYRDLSNAVRHLTYHLFPMQNAEESWLWNLQQLADRWSLFNGKKILGINTDENTATLDEVLAICSCMGIEWDHIVERPNDPGLGEVLTWVPSLEFLDPEDAQPNEVVFSAHAKGVKYGGCPPLIREWTDCMYRANLDSWFLVKQQLEWFQSAGAFKARYRRMKGCRYGWYYSGAFWWWRLADVGRARGWRGVGSHYAGRELWVGDVVPYEDGGVVFTEATKSPYDPRYWDKTIRPRYHKFLQTEISGMHTEAMMFAELFTNNKPGTVIEVGSRNINGSVRNLFPGSVWTGLDLYDGPDVDVVIDCLYYTPSEPVDMVACCEVLEHAGAWREMLVKMSTWLKPGGLLLVTCAGPGRAPHSHIDGCQLRPGEYYGNISVAEILEAVAECGVQPLICRQLRNDTQFAAVRK